MYNLYAENSHQRNKKMVIFSMLDSEVRITFALVRRLKPLSG